MAASILQYNCNVILSRNESYIFTGKYKNHMRNRFLSLNWPKRTLLLALFLTLQITGSANAYVIKENSDDSTTDVIKSEITTQIIQKTTTIKSEENLPAETYVSADGFNKNISNPTTLIVPEITQDEIKSVIEHDLSSYEDNQLSKDIQESPMSKVYFPNNKTVGDEINEIKPAPTQTEDVELVQKVDIFSSELFPNSNSFITSESENLTNIENLEETIRNSVKNEIEVEQNISSSALLDVLQEIPELQLRRSLAEEILYNKDPFNKEQEQDEHIEHVKVSPVFNELELEEKTENYRQNNTKEEYKNTINLVEVQTPSASVIHPAEGSVETNAVTQEISTINDIENVISWTISSQEQNTIGSTQGDDTNSQEQFTSQPFLVEIKESIFSNEDFSEIPRVIETYTNELAQDIFSIDKITEATKYIESELKSAAANGDNPHLIIKKQGVEVVPHKGHEKAERDFIGIATKFSTEDTTKLTDEAQYLTTEFILTDTDVIEVFDKSSESYSENDYNKNISGELEVIQSPSDSMIPKDAGTVEEISEALLSHSIKDAIYPYSLYSTRHSTLILCSISLLLLLFLLLTIFLKMERHHGTLNIEMQEQRCGKDQSDEEFEKCLKLLDVEKSLPSAVIEDESEECLQTSAT